MISGLTSVSVCLGAENLRIALFSEKTISSASTTLKRSSPLPFSIICLHLHMLISECSLVLLVFLSVISQFTNSIFFE